MDYRQKHNYKGQIYTAVGYYGWFPEVAVFNDAYGQEIKTTETCLEYEKEQMNIPTILWNAFTWELMLSAVKQSAPQDRPALTVLREMLEALKPYANQPSKSSQVIEDYFIKKGLKFSVAPLFSNEIHKLAEECKSKLAAGSKTEIEGSQGVLTYLLICKAILASWKEMKITLAF